MPARPCAHHADSPSVARCTRCDRAICLDCYGAARHGFAVCMPCANQIPEDAPQWERGEATTSNFDAFWRTWWQAVRSPEAFFARLPEQGSWVPAAAFGLICMGLGTLMSTIWGLALNERLRETLMESAVMASVPPMAVRALTFARIPFIVPIIMLVHVSLLHTSAALAGAPHPDRKTIARIFGYATAGYLFLAIPPFGDFSLGHLLMLVWMFNLETAGLRRFYGLGPWRTMFASMVPMLIASAINCL